MGVMMETAGADRCCVAGAFTERVSYQGFY